MECLANVPSRESGTFAELPRLVAPIGMADPELNVVSRSTSPDSKHCAAKRFNPGVMVRSGRGARECMLHSHPH